MVYDIWKNLLKEKRQAIGDLEYGCGTWSSGSQSLWTEGGGFFQGVRGARDLAGVRVAQELAERPFQVILTKQLEILITNQTDSLINSTGIAGWSAATL